MLSSCKKRKYISLDILTISNFTFMFSTSLQSWSSTAEVIAEISNYLTTQEQLNMLKQFSHDKGSLFGTSVSIVENAIDISEANLKWSNAHLDKLVLYLSDKNPVYRLSKDVIPDVYDIYIKPYLKPEDAAKQFTFDAEVNITLHAAARNIRKITLHKDYIDILEALLYDVNGNIVEKIQTESILYEDITDKLTVYLSKALQENEKYILYFKYQGQIRSGLAGVFRATYDNVK